MKWPWRRRKIEPLSVAPVPEPEPEPPPQLSPMFVAHDLDLEEHITATSNVMAIRDATNVFLAIVQDHRLDGHECLPYCVPAQLAYFLQVMDEDDLRNMLTVLLKDMVENYLRQQRVEED